MASGVPIRIGDRVYWKNPDVDRYQIQLEELGAFRVNQIPGHSHVEILGLPTLSAADNMECYGLNSGDDGDIDLLYVYGGASFKVQSADEPRFVARLRRAFPYMDRDERGLFRNPSISSNPKDDGFDVHLHLSFNFDKAPETLLRDAVSPFVDGYHRLEKPSVHVFICHASEDKPAARTIASALKRFGADVWLDEWEIRVGESIVQKVGDALGAVSHLLVLLSKNSVDKPWVCKELSSALMRQLSNRSISILPLRLDDCSIPTILADIKYADARMGIEHALGDIEQGLLADFDQQH